MFRYVFIMSQLRLCLLAECSAVAVPSEDKCTIVEYKIVRFLAVGRNLLGAAPSYGNRRLRGLGEFLSLDRVYALVFTTLNSTFFLQWRDRVNTLTIQVHFIISQLWVCLPAKSDSIAVQSGDRCATEENNTVTCPALGNNCPRLHTLMASEKGIGAFDGYREFGIFVFGPCVRARDPQNKIDHVPHHALLGRRGKYIPVRKLVPIIIYR